MDFTDPNQRRVFFELHSGLPREGPGDRASTARALALAQPLPPSPRILDLACGPGAQTLDLADLLPDAAITAIDLHPPFVLETGRRMEAAGLGDRVEVLRGDMTAPPQVRGGYDLIWCEGAAYIVGVQRALAVWGPLLAPSGRIAFTEPVFLTAAPSAAVRANWAEYPAMGDVELVRRWIAEAGLALLGDFVLPDRAWREYYDPLDARRAALELAHLGDPLAMGVLAEARAEVAAYHEHSDEYGYAFVVASN